LKAIIGWEQEKPLPPLEKSETPKEFAKAPSLAATIKEGLANRPDLIALRKRIQAQEYNVRIADRNAMISLSVDALYNRNFSPLVEDQRRLTLLASIPLFDGGFLKEAARQQRIELNTQKVLLTQAERVAAAEIESAWHVLSQNTLRVQAAAAALEASQLNYEAAAESQRLGAEGTSVITVLTARVSLVTAESNFVQALYDYYISVTNLKLVTGQPLPGEPKLEEGYIGKKK
jgi:outer membrane protein